MSEGLAFVDHLGWDAYNESKDLKPQVGEFRLRHGYYPEVVLGDQLYGSRENRKYLKENGIRFGGKALGRPPKKTAENAEHLEQMKKQRTQDSRKRIPIEGKFGQGKNGYRLNSIFLVMNLTVLWEKSEKIIKKTSLSGYYHFLEKIFTQLLPDWLKSHRHSFVFG